MLNVDMSVFHDVMDQVEKATLLKKDIIMGDASRSETLRSLTSPATVNNIVSAFVIVDDFKKLKKGAIHKQIVAALKAHKNLQEQKNNDEDGLSTSTVPGEKVQMKDLCENSSMKLNKKVPASGEIPEGLDIQEAFFYQTLGMSPVLILFLMRLTCMTTNSAKTAKQYFINMHAQIPSNHRTIPCNKCFGTGNKTTNAGQKKVSSGIVDNIVTPEGDMMLGSVGMVGYFYKITDTSSADTVKLKPIIASAGSGTDDNSSWELANDVHGQMASFIDIVELHDMIVVSVFP